MTNFETIVGILLTLAILAQTYVLVSRHPDITSSARRKAFYLILACFLLLYNTTHL